MDCKCRISPRKQFDDFTHVCTECGGKGGRIGNVCHAYGCTYLRCHHSNYYTGTQIYPTAEEYWDMWRDPPNLCLESPHYSPKHYHFPSDKIIDIHKIFSKRLKDEMIVARLKMHDHLMIKLYDTIELKTGRRISYRPV